MKILIKPIDMLKNALKITIPLLSFFVLFAFIRVELFDDFLQLQKITAPTDFISTILGVLATIISITVAIIILSFETFKQKAGEYAIEYFGNIKWLHYLVSLYITSIVLTFLSLIEISKSKEVSDCLNLLYFNTYLFIVALGLLLVFSYKLFQSISVNELITYYYDRLNVKNIIGNRAESDKQISIKDALKDPLFVLEDLGLSYVRKGDFIVANFIYSKLSHKIIDAIKSDEDKNCKQYLNYLSTVYNNVIPEAIYKNNDVLLSKIWALHHRIHSSLGINRASSFWSYYSDFGCNYYKILVQNGKYDLAEYFFRTAFYLFYNNDLKELFPEEKRIYSLAQYFPEEYTNLYGKVDPIKGLNRADSTWCEFIDAYLNIYYKCGIFNLKNNNERGLISVIHSMSKHTKFGNRLSSAPLKSFYIYRAFYPIIRELLDRAIDRGILRNDTDEILRDINPLSEIGYDGKVLYERAVLTDYCNLLIYLQRHGIISYYILGGLSIGMLTLTGELGTLVDRYLNGYEKEDNMLGCLETIVEVFEVLKKNIERDLTKGKSQGLHYQLRERLKEMSVRLSTTQTTNVRLTEMFRKVNSLIRNMTKVRKDIGIE